MNCAEARHIILSADPDALHLRSDPVLRRHLDGCTDCSAAVSYVVADMARLRAAVAARAPRPVMARPRRSRTRVAMTLVPMALAAELAFFAFLGLRDNPSSLTDRLAMDSVVSILPPTHTEIDTGEVVAAPITKRVAGASRQPDSASRRDTVAKRRDSVVAPTLRVMPSARQQYAVIATSNPKVTVVWLTKGDTL
jgi:hypothetical protein